MVFTVNAVNDAPIANTDTPVISEDTPTSINVLGNDTDTEGGVNTATVAIPQAPTHGTASVNPDGSILYTPAANFTGLDTLIYAVCDNGAPALCDTAMVIMNVTPVNDKPIAANDGVGTPLDTPVSGTVATNDSDVDNNIDPLGFTKLIDPVNGTIVFNTNGTYTYTPNTGFLGKDSVTYKVCDLTSLCDTAILYISIPFNVNDLPLAVNDTTTTPEDVALNGTVAANDTDNSGRFDPNGFVKLDNPQHGTIVFNPNGTYTYTPTKNFNGVDSIHYAVCNNLGFCDTATLIITTSAVNDAPIAQDNFETLNEDSGIFNGTVANNDSDTDNLANELAYTQLGTTPNTEGVFTLNANGTYAFTPAANFNGVVTITYKVCDTGGLCDTATLTITVNAVNTAPIALNDTVSVEEELPISGSVATNDTDENIAGLTFTLVDTLPNTQGDLVFNADGTYTFTPTIGFVGTATVVYKVCDAQGLCDTASLKITVNPQPCKNIIAQEKITVTNSCAVDDVVCISVPRDDIPKYRISVDGTPYTGAYENCAFDTTFNYSYFVLPARGAAGPYKIDWDINGNTVSISSVTNMKDLADSMKIRDISGNWALNTGAFTIVGGNSQNTYGTMTVTRIRGNAVVGRLQVNRGLIARGTGLKIGKGSHILTIHRITSGCPDSAQLLVACVKKETKTVETTVGKTDTVCFNTSELIGNTFKTTTLCNPTGGLFTFDTVANKTCIAITSHTAGKDSLCVKVCDELGICDTTYVIVNILGINTAPLANRDDVSTPLNTLVSITVMANDTDIEGALNPASVTVIQNPTKGVTLVNANGTISYIPATGFVGTDTLIYRVCDNGTPALCDTALVVITVTAPYCVDILTDKIIVAKCPTDSLVCINIPKANINQYTLTLDGTPYQNTLIGCGFSEEGTGLKIGNGKHLLTLDKINTTCKDSIEIIVVCPQSNTDSILVIKGTSDTICLDTRQLVGTNFTVTNVCAGTDSIVSFSIVPNLACIAISAKNFGRDTICFTVCDEKGICDTTYIRIKVTAADIRATDDSTIAVMNTPITINVMGNDTAFGSGNTSVLIINNPANGTAQVRSDGSIVYTPNQDYCSSKPDSLTYILCNNAGCDTAVVKITIPCEDIKIYTGFSPNDDGMNDFLVIEGLEKYPDNRLCVYNRWGNLVYDVKAYKNDWAGKFDNQLLPDGTYFYVFDRGDSKPMYGYVQIHR